LNVISDLHLSLQGMPLPAAEADITILAGDISRPRAAIEWARAIATPVLYVPGNHEFYGDTIKGGLADLKRLSANSRIHLLDNTELIMQGVRFLGSTLWTDFNLHGPQQRPLAITQALAMLRDFTRIGSDTQPGKPLTPVEYEAMFSRNRAWLQRKLDEPYAGPTVVITHHAPSPKSIHARFAGSPINTCFVSDSEHLMGKDRCVLWIHGHTHNSFDYVVKGTRVVCNPRGYVLNGEPENPAFDPDLVLEVERP
jgi:predicted phosphodiesterase